MSDALNQLLLGAACGAGAYLIFLFIIVIPVIKFKAYLERSKR